MWGACEGLKPSLRTLARGNKADCVGARHPVPLPRAWWVEGVARDRCQKFSLPQRDPLLAMGSPLCMICVISQWFSQSGQTKELIW